jgi:hypothetical protein
MKHLEPYTSRKVLVLPIARVQGWSLKRYAILSKGHVLDEKIAEAALQAAVARLPIAGDLINENSNHGVGFQIVHFAETAVVTPAFYWQWGSVLSNVAQMRAPWDRPTEFRSSHNEIVGCVWEMDIVNLEVAAWKSTVLRTDGTPEERLEKYLMEQC